MRNIILGEADSAWACVCGSAGARVAAGRSVASRYLLLLNDVTVLVEGGSVGWLTVTKVRLQYGAVHFLVQVHVK